MAFDAFLKLEGIQGESKDQFHKDEIDVLSFAWSVSTPADTAVPEALFIVKATDRASPKLLEKLHVGDTIPTGLLTIRREGSGVQPEYLKIGLQEVTVENFAIDGTANTRAGFGMVRMDIPRETFGLSFIKIAWEYKMIGSDQTDVFGWDYQVGKGT